MYIVDNLKSENGISCEFQEIFENGIWNIKFYRNKLGLICNMQPNVDKLILTVYHVECEQHETIVVLHRRRIHNKEKTLCQSNYNQANQQQTS